MSQKKAIVTLTDAAAERVRDLMARADRPVKGLRIGVRNKGCSGMSYHAEYADEVKPMDEVVEDKGACILIEPMASFYLIGTEIDWFVDKLESRFTFNNPNETARCGCGESFSVAQAENS